MKTLKNILKIAVPVLGLSFGSLNGYSQKKDYCKEITRIIFNSYRRKPNFEYIHDQKEIWIKEFHSKKGKLIQYYEKGDLNVKIYNKKNELIFEYKTPKKGINDNNFLEMFNKEPIV